MSKRPRKDKLRTPHHDRMIKSLKEEIPGDINGLCEFLETTDPDIDDRIRRIAKISGDPEAGIKCYKHAYDWAYRLRKANSCWPDIPAFTRDPSKGLREMRWWCQKVINQSNNNDDFQSGQWFTLNTKIPPARLRAAAAVGPKRKGKRVRSKVIDGVKCYSLSDARRWWPTDMKKA